MSTTAFGTDDRAVVSVRDLVHRRLGIDGDPWNLALVQRAEVWRAPRMLRLLDSLIAGYPIGALLICRVTAQSKVIARVDGVRRVTDADKAAWQLLDGQQRINALYSIFTQHGQYGRFFVHMTTPRETPDPSNRSRKSNDLPAYLAWRDVPERDESEPLEERHLHIDLSNWFDWALANDGRLRDVSRGLSEDPSSVVATMREIDGEFAETLTDAQSQHAAGRLRRLISVWNEPSVPILRTEVGDPLDVLEVFTRINIGGVQIIGSDVYFAAVKTFWPDAESRIDRLSGASTFLDRTGALRFASRLGSVSLGQGDILQLTVDRLAGARGVALIEALQRLTADDSRVVEHIASFDAEFMAWSQLGHGLRQIGRDLWDPVLAWAAVSRRADAEWWRENTPTIDAYVLGAQLFRYSGILGERFQRAAFREAVAAGVEGRDFPLTRILGVIRRASPQLSGSRKAVRGLSLEADRQMLADSNTALLAGIAQRLPFHLDRPIDWDHIYPSARATRMWTLSPYGRRVRHPDRHFVNSAGNMWALDASTNRALQAAPPREKFALLEKSLSTLLDQKSPYAIWPRDQWSLDSSEVQEFIEIDALLTDDEDSVSLAMARFRRLIVARSQRLLDEAFKKFPGARLFAADEEVEDADPAADSAADLARTLNLGEVVLMQSSAEVDALIPQRSGHRLDGVPFWLGRGEELQWAVEMATRWHAKLRHPEGRSMPGGADNGFDYRRYVRIGKPDTGSYFAIGVVSRFAVDGETPFWLQVWKKTAGFPTIEDRIMSSRFAADVRRDDGHIWLPLRVDTSVTWGGLNEAVYARSLEIREVIEGPLDPEE